MSKALKIAVANVKQQIAGKLYLKTGTDFTKPVQVYCLLTYRCNARCKMCDHWRMEKYPEELPAEVWIEALKDLKKFSPGAHVQFTGGEVLMKKDFLDILEWCGKNGLSAGMVTNAGLITPEIAARLVHCRPNNVNISIDSPYSEVHDDLRGRAGFLEKVIAAIGYLRKESEEQDTKLAISIKPTLSRLNIESMPELLEKAVEWGATMLNIQPLTVRTDDVTGMDISGYESAGKIIDMAPSILLIADAVTFGEPPGETCVFTPEDLIQEMPSTHGPGFGALVGYLSQFMPNLEIRILAVEPKSVGLMTPMSDVVNAAIEKIVAMFEENPV
ncbi:MAG: hydrogenase maturation protease [bacterium]